MIRPSCTTPTILASQAADSHAAIMPSVAGWARIIGHNNILVDDRDPLAHGFQLM